MTPENINLAATVAVAVANILLAVFTFRYMRLTGQMVRHMRRGLGASLVAELTFDGHSAHLAIANSGTAAARNVRFITATGFEWVQHPEWKEVVTRGISYLPAGRTMRYWLGFPNWQTVKEQQPVVHIALQYESEGTTETRDFVIDMSQYLGASPESSPVDQLVEAIRQLESSRHLDRSLDQLFRPRTKGCVECAEPIPNAAKKCSHCGAEQPQPNGVAGA